MSRKNVFSKDGNKLICINCGTTLRGIFCHHCGQAADTARYTFKSFSHEFYKSVSSVSVVAVSKTFFTLATQPGRFLRDYLGGMRVGYTNPIKYFFYAFVLELTVRGFLIWLTNDNDHFAAQGVKNIQVQILDLVSTFFWGFLWWAFYRRSGFNFTENSVCALYFVAQMGFYSTIFLLLSAPFVSHSDFYIAISIVEFIAEAAYAFFFARRLFRDPIWKVVPKQILLTVLYALMILGFHAIALSFT